MKILFLDLASNSAEPDQGACIACVECEAAAEHETLSEAERSRRVSSAKTEAIRFVDHRIGDSGVMPMLDEVLKEARWDDKDLTHVACVTGPGGFTSLRMAVTLANTYADQLGIPVAGINLSDLYKERLAVSDQQLAIWMHSTKKTHLFIHSFGSDQWPEPTLISIEDLAAQLPEGSSIVGEILPEHRAAIAAKNPEYPIIKTIKAVLPSFLSALHYKQTSLVPWYGRGW